MPGMVNNPESIIEILGLRPLPDEGGMWSQVLIDQYSTAIYYLLRDGDFSALHRLPGPEVYHHYMGAPLGMLLLHPNGAVTEPVLGTDLRNDERPAVVVPGDVWQGSRSLGEWSLVGTTMAPPFDSAEFALGDAGRLAETYPSVTDRIAALTR